MNLKIFAIVLFVAELALTAPSNKTDDKPSSDISLETCENRTLCTEEIVALRQNVDHLTNELALTYSQPSTPVKECTLTQFVFLRDNQQADYIRYKRYFPKLKFGTVCFWYKVEDLSYLVPLVSYETSASGNHILIELRPPSVIRLIIYGSQNDFSFNMKTSVNYHICGWFDSENKIMGFYINGEQFGPKGYTGDIVHGGGNLVIGQDENRNVQGGFYTNRSLRGKVDNVIVYPRVLSRNEIERMRFLCQCPVDHVVSMTLDRVEFSGETTYTIPDVCPQTF